MSNNNINEDRDFEARKEKARELFFSKGEIYCPYFGTNIILNSLGFNHLQYSSKGKRGLRDRGITIFNIHYWGFVALIKRRLIRVILRQIADQDIVFWSVMPARKIEGTQNEPPE